MVSFLQDFKYICIEFELFFSDKYSSLEKLWKKSFNFLFARKEKEKNRFTSKFNA